MKEYLTEKKLGEILKHLKPNLNFINNKNVPNSILKRHRPDYRCEEIKLILEFDGYRHYCDPKVILSDIKKDEEYEKLGYRVFRIPYFIQMSSKLLELIFNEEIEYKQTYPDGFIDEKAMLPASFCSMGIEKFEEDLKKFDYAYDSIFKSMERINKDHREIIYNKKTLFQVKKSGRLYDIFGYIDLENTAIKNFFKNDNIIESYNVTVEINEDEKKELNETIIKLNKRIEEENDIEDFLFILEHIENNFLCASDKFLNNEYRIIKNIKTIDDFCDFIKKEDFCYDDDFYKSNDEIYNYFIDNECSHIDDTVIFYRY